MKAIKGYIFDLDGTLLNTIADLGGALNRVLKKNNLPLHSLMDYQKLVGHGLEKLVAKAIPENADRGKILKEFLAEYDQCFCDQSVLYDGILNMLLTLQKKGALLAICTNKKQEYTDKIIEHYLSKISFISVIGDRFDDKQKPNPFYTHLIAKEMNLPLSAIYFIGDSDVDMQTARNAGLIPIGVSWGFRTQEELLDNGARAILQKPMDLVELDI